VSPVPVRPRLLARNDLVKPQESVHKRRYRRWQQDAPMHLDSWASSAGCRWSAAREAKLVTGIDVSPGSW
jgi:hypothetical protein